MRLLLDTHFVVDLVLAPHTLSQRERAALRDAGGTPAVSAVSFWELRIKWGTRTAAGLRKGPIDPVLALRTMEEAGFPVLHVTPRHATATLIQPLPHRDPFDDMLVVQAQVEGLHMLSRDRQLVGHPLVVAV